MIKCTSVLEPHDFCSVVISFTNKHVINDDVETVQTDQEALKHRSDSNISSDYIVIFLSLISSFCGQH